MIEYHPSRWVTHRTRRRPSHERIVEIAAARMRESGTEGPGVAEMMQAAGLTHGGFYKHFGSRDDLVAEAVERACDDVERGAPRGARRRRRTAGGVRRLLPRRRNTATGRLTGAPWSALGAGRRARRRAIARGYRGRVERYLTRLEDLLGGRDAPLPRSARWSARSSSRARGGPGAVGRDPGRRAGAGGYGEVTGAWAGSAAMSQLPTRLTAIIAATAAAGAAGAAIANAGRQRVGHDPDGSHEPGAAPGRSGRRRTGRR